MTRAPAALPSWTAPLPTPPAAACTSSVSPAASCARRCSPNHPVWYVMWNGAASASSSPAGAGNAARRVHEGVLGERPRGQHRPADHPVSRGEAGDVRAGLDDLAAQLDAGAERQRRADLVGAAAHQHVGEVRGGARAPAPGAARGRAPAAAPRPAPARPPARRTGLPARPSSLPPRSAAAAATCRAATGRCPWRDGRSSRGPPDAAGRGTCPRPSRPPARRPPAPARSRRPRARPRRPAPSRRASGCARPAGRRSARSARGGAYVAASHSANPTAACLVTEYGAAPSIVSRPAADAVTTNVPAPRSSQPGSSARAARTWASVLTSHARCH